MSQRVSQILLHALFFFSGAAALGYQLVWSKMFSTGLGHETPAVLAIIAAFMGGMALGAAVIDRFIPRSARAGLWLGGLELTIGAWAMLVSFLIPSANDFALRLIGLAPGGFQHWMIAFTMPALVLLPATAAMGAMLPAMEKFLSALAPQNESVGSVYAANTFGAVSGTLLAPFVLMPALGFSRSCWVLAMVNGGVSVMAFGLARAQRAVSLPMNRSAGLEPASCAPTPQAGWKPALHPASEALENDEALRRTTPHPHSLSPLRGEGGLKRAPLSSRRLALSLFITGLLGISYEVAGVRVLSQVLEGTVFTYAAVLAVFLLGTAAGATAFHRCWRRYDAERLLPVLLYGAGLAGMVGLFALMFSGWIYQHCRALGDGPPAVLGAEMITASAVFALPAFFMGAIFSQLTQLARSADGGIGRGLAANTLGAALAPAVVVALLPMLGTKWLLFATAAGYFLVNLPARPPRLGNIFTLGFLLTVALGFNARLQRVNGPPGGKTLSYQEGVMASVAVLADPNDQRTLRVDNRFQMGGTAAADAEYRQAHLPLLLHPNPQRALFLGVGTGISLGAASLYPQLRTDGVELVPEVVDAMQFFGAKNFSAARLPNFKLYTADARRFVRATDERYDVIIADLFHPYRDGAGALYTREHFAAIRQRLATNGLFCQWLPLHQLDEPTLRTIVRTLQSEFRFAEAWLLRFNVDVPVVALIGRLDDQGWQTNVVESRLHDPRLNEELKRLALADSLRLHGHRLAGPEDLRAFAGAAPLNTDDNQRVTFQAPRAAYQRAAKPYASLLALLEASKTRQIEAGPFSGPGEAEFAARLSRYVAARNAYLRGLVHDAEQRRAEALAAYIESARLSPDFTSGYAQCLALAGVMAKSDPAVARSLLERLIEAQPARPVARQMLERLFPR